MEIFNNAGMFEQMLDIANWAERSGWDSPRVKYHKAGALRMLGDSEQAQEIIDALLDAEFDEGYKDYFHVEATHLAEARGDFDTALYHINKAIEIAPDFTYRQVILANTHRLRGAFKEALSICNSLLQEQPDFLYALLTRGDVYFDQKKYDRARDDFEAMLVIHPENEQAIDRIVSTYVDESKYDKAIEWTLRRIDIFESINNYLDLAYLHDCKGAQKEAEETYKKLLDRFPETGIGNRFYGFYLSRRERHEEAIAQYIISLDKEPEQADLYEEWAYSLRVLKRYEEALEILEKGEEMAAGNRGAILMQRGLILERMCRYEESLECMLEAAKLPDEIQGWTLAGVYNEIGLTFRGNKNDAENALKYFQKALELDENFADANENMGHMNMYYFKNYAEAIKYYDRAILLRPDEPRTYLERARARLKSGKLFSGGAAKKDYKTALLLYEMKSEEDPSPCNQIYITICKLGLGEETKAKEFFTEMIDTPSKPDAWCARPKCDCCLYWLGQISEKERNYSEALKYYEEAVSISNSIRHNLVIEELKLQM
jgi:tetratricopeptide (TPR) repeat protein